MAVPLALTRVELGVPLGTALAISLAAGAGAAALGVGLPFVRSERARRRR